MIRIFLIYYFINNPWLDLIQKSWEIYHCVAPYESWTSVHQRVINQLSAASLEAPCTELWSSWRRGMASISALAAAARVEPAGSEYVTPIQIYGRWLIHNFVSLSSTWQSVLFHQRHVIHHHLQNVGDIHQKKTFYRKLLVALFPDLRILWDIWDHSSEGILSAARR